MTAPRFIQNFSQCRALVISRDSRAIDALDVTLPKLGLGVVQVPPGEDGAMLSAEGLDPERDILIVDGDLHRPLLWPNASPCELPPVPVVGMVGVEAPSRLKALMQIGSTAFIAKPVHGATVFSALVLGVNEHARKRQLLADIAGHEQRRRQRRFVIKAVVQIVTAEKVSDEIAYDRLRRESMRARMSVEAFSEMLVQRWAGEKGPGPLPLQMTGE